MLIRILSDKVPLYEDAIRETIYKSIPEPTDRAITSIYRKLLIDHAQLWLSYQDKVLDGIIITQISDNDAVGGRMLTLLCGWSPTGTGLKSFMDAYKTMSKFAKSHKCMKIDLYTQNEHIVKYIRSFPIDFESTYFQIPLE